VSVIAVHAGPAPASEDAVVHCDAVDVSEALQVRDATSPSPSIATTTAALLATAAMTTPIATTLLRLLLRLLLLPMLLRLLLQYCSDLGCTALHYTALFYYTTVYRYTR
jgi:hypothetical protein